MKKIIFVLAICFIAAPAFAEVAVTLDFNEPANTVTVKYSGADPCNPAEMPRAFALDLTIDSPGVFTGISGYKAESFQLDVDENDTGESNSLFPGFGIYPARIKWWLKPGDDACDVNSWGSPLADNVNDPGAGTGIGTGHIVLEFASLYYNKEGAAESNAPEPNGTLCVLGVTNSGGSNLNLHMIDEDTYRGGLVFEDGSTDDIDVNMIVYGGCDEPIPATTPTPTNGAVGVAVPNPALSWSPAAGGVNPKYDVYFDTVTPPVTVVSTNQTTLSYVATGAVQGKTYYWKIVSKNDCNPTGVSSAIWSFDTDCLKTSDTGYNYWKFLGSPDCFCYIRHCRGDGNGKMSLSKPVTLADFTTFTSGYNLKYTSMIGLVDGAGVPSVCADYNHKASLSKPVTLADFTIFTTYYNLKYTQGVPVCDGTNINFWTAP